MTTVTLIASYYGRAMAQMKNGWSRATTALVTQLTVVTHRNELLTTELRQVQQQRDEAMTVLQCLQQQTQRGEKRRFVKNWHQSKHWRIKNVSNGWAVVL